MTGAEMVGSPPIQTDVEISFVIVDYNSGPALRACIRAIRETVAARHEIILVENAKPNGASDQADLVLRPGRNAGWGGAVAVAARRARGEFVHLITPDMRMHPGAIDGMLASLREDGSLGALGAYAVRPDGSFDKYHNRFPTPLALFLTVYAPRRVAIRFAAYRKYHMLDQDFRGRIDVHQPAGHCLMVRRALLSPTVLAGSWGQHFADVEVAAGVWEGGYRIAVDDRFRATHDHQEGPRPPPEKTVALTSDFLHGAIRHFRERGRVAAAHRAKALLLVGQAARTMKSAAGSILRLHGWASTRAEASLVPALWRERNLMLEPAA